MDRLVSIDLKEIELTFKPNQICKSTFKLKNLMHTMSVAISLTTTNPNLFSFNQSFSLLKPLSSSSFTLFLSLPSDFPPISSPPHTLFVHTSILPTGKAHEDDLKRLFSKPGSHIFKDAKLPISFVGDYVVKFLLSHPFRTLETSFLLSKAISGCTQTQITHLLSSAVISGNPSSVWALIKAGGDLNYRDSFGKSLLFSPVNSGNLDLVRVLIESGIKIDCSIDWFLHDSAAINRVDLMELLCNCGISINSIDSFGRKPIHVSAMNGNLEALKFCLSKGCDIDSIDSNGWTSLHYAASKGKTLVLEFLLESSSYSKYAITKDGKTPFLLAIDNGYSNLLDSLRLDDDLYRSARIGDVNGLKNGIEQGVDNNDGKDQNGLTTLHRASLKVILRLLRF